MKIGREELLGDTGNKQYVLDLKYYYETVLLKWRKDFINLKEEKGGV